MKVVVVGAGIAGLAAAWELTQSGGCDVTLLESERRAGGVIVTEQMDGFIVEGGPDGFLAGEPELPALARELGIGDHVVRQVARGTALWTGKGGALQPIDEGQAAALLGIDAAKAEVAKGFSTFAEGMAEPVAALAQRLAGSLRFAQGVAGIVAEANRWRIAITGGSAHEAGGVVLALPAYAAGRLLEGVGVARRRGICRGIAPTNPRLHLCVPEIPRPRPGWPCPAARVSPSDERRSRRSGARPARRDPRNPRCAALVASVLLGPRVAALSRPPCGAGRCGAPAPEPAAPDRDRRRRLRWRGGVGVCALRKGSRPPHGTVDGSLTSGITSSAKRSISSSCGLNCSSNRSTPACSNARMRSAIWSGVPVRPAFSPRFETE